MNWSIYALWDYYHWTSIVFVVAILFEMVIAMIYGRRLFSSKPKVSDKIQSVDYQRNNRSKLRGYKQ